MGYIIFLGFLVLPLGSLGLWFWRRSRREPIDLIEKLDIGRVIGRTFSVFRVGGWPLAAMAVLLLGLPPVASGLFQPMIWAKPSPHSVLPGQGFPGFNALQALGGHQSTSAISMLAGLAVMLVAFLFQIPATILLASRFEGEPMDLAEAWRRTPRLVLPYIGVFVLFILGISIGFLLFLWPGILWGLSWSVVLPVLVIERTGVIDSFRRSHALTIGSRGRLLLIAILFYIATIVVSVPGSFIALRLGETGFPMLLAWQCVVSVLGGLLGVSLFASLYVELRQIHEGGSGSALAEVFA